MRSCSHPRSWQGRPDQGGSCSWSALPSSAPVGRSGDAPVWLDRRGRALCGSALPYRGATRSPRPVGHEAPPPLRDGRDRRIRFVLAIGLLAHLPNRFPSKAVRSVPPHAGGRVFPHGNTTVEFCSQAIHLRAWKVHSTNYFALAEFSEVHMRALHIAPVRCGERPG